VEEQHETRSEFVFKDEINICQWSQNNHPVFPFISVKFIFSDRY